MARFPFLPREERFFDLFEKGAANLRVAAAALQDLVDDYTQVEEKVRRIKDLEEAGDDIIHQIMGQLHRTFITPLEREDIALLAHSLDDVVDFIEGAASTMRIYRIPQPTPTSRKLATIVSGVAGEVEKSILRLRHRRELKGILEHCVEINRLENEADDLLQEALGELFNNTTDVIEIIKWREIYEQMENATDRGEDIANVLEGIVLSHA